MKKTILLILLFIAIVPLDCKTNEPAKAPIKENHQFLADCKLGCENLSDIQCLKDQTVESCTNTCLDVQLSSKEMDPKCWAALISCDEFEACRKN